MIPIYPNFKKLELNDKEEIESITSKFPPYSDYNFLSLWVYDTNEAIEISLLNDNLVVKFQDYTTKEPFYSFLGVNEVQSTADTLLNLSSKENLSEQLKLIPEAVINSNELWYEKFTLTEDPDNSDYIISATSLSQLEEPKYKRKKHFIEDFTTNYPTYRVQFLDLNDAQYQKQVLDLFSLWAEQSEKNHVSDIEFNAFQRLCKSINNFEFFTLGIFLNTKLLAFDIYELTFNNYAISSFQKGNKEYRGVFAMLNYEVAKHLDSLNCQLINYEQDLGIEGLRNSKISYHPVSFLKKFIISR